ncbi:Multiple antibiotic resistance protein marC [Cardiobacterium hominis]|uniref:UPF0056 membrane protein n=1 Tax=Cardiobacterium hominis TaxID=2718 RepID=A0A1C3H2V7_9GAMM|nr:MarC family protein [Cardiobacterium hominis]SAM59922.1 Multiple antibiotic resistance protein marC [Cardiobacterium hominis]
METLWATAITLFLIMDPLGNVPIFLIVLERVAEHRRRYIILRELIIALIVMLLFLFAGPAMLRTLGISPEAVAIAGGLVLLIIAIRMIFPLRGSSVMGDDDEDHGEPLLVPLAIPLLAGPSLLATLMLRANSGNILQHTLPALLLAWVASAVILLASPFLYRIFGNRGLKAMERLMGMVLICISVQMLLNAFARVLH